MRKQYCKICEFFSRCKWLRPQFEKSAREGMSLRHLQTLLLGMGLKVDTKTISSHLRHMNIEVQEQRGLEKGLRKKPLKAILKLRQFFKPSEPQTPNRCEHKRVKHFWSLTDECVKVKCLDCGLIIDSYDSERTITRREKRLLENLGIARERRKK